MKSILALVYILLLCSCATQEPDYKFKAYKVTQPDGIYDDMNITYEVVEP